MVVDGGVLAWAWNNMSRVDGGWKTIEKYGVHNREFWGGVCLRNKRLRQSSNVKWLTFGIITCFFSKFY